MNINEVLRTKGPKKDKMVSVRVPENVKLWMEEKGVSPTKIFKKGIKNIGGPWK